MVDCQEVWCQAFGSVGPAAPRGQTPIRPGIDNRFGANVLSAIINRGNLAFMVFKRHFTAWVFVRFLRRLVKLTERKVFLIEDGPLQNTRIMP